MTTPSRQPHPQEPESKIKRAIDILERSYIAGTPVLIMDKASGAMITIDADAIPFFRCALSPHTSAPAPEQDDALTAAYLIGKADGAKAAREQTLKPFIELRDSLRDIESIVIKGAMTEIIESLRTQQEQPR